MSAVTALINLMINHCKSSSNCDPKYKSNPNVATGNALKRKGKIKMLTIIFNHITTIIMILTILGGGLKKIESFRRDTSTQEG